MHKFFITACVAALTAAPVAAASLPQSGRLDFDVFRKGKDIGDYSYQFTGTEDAFTVQVETDIKVKVFGITAYSFTQSSTETWNDGQLQAVRSVTNDDGDTHELNMGASDLLPASLWDIDILGQPTLLNTIDGSTTTVSASNLGAETVASGHGNVATQHYRLSGGLMRDLWYDADGNLARIEFKGDDGSTITYVRR